MSLRIAATLVALSLVALACGQSDDSTDSSTTSAQVTTATVAEPSSSTSTPPASTSTVPGSTTTVYTGPVSPLNGLPVEDAALLDRKLIGVKIDNHWNARPQSGIEQADAMMEIVVEGGLTRFIALFHHTDVEWLGPMRSGRPTDASMLAPLNGALAISGAQPWVQRLIVDDGVPLIGDLGIPVTRRWGERRAPHNLYGNTIEMRAVAEQRGLDQAPPEPLFEWGPIEADPTSIATDILFDWTDSVDVRWEWDGAQYVRFADEDPHNWRTMESDVETQVAADTLVVLKAERYIACPRGTGSCVPAWTTVGDNEAIVFADGQYVDGSWAREEIDEWFSVTDAAGAPIVVPPGRVWIMVYPDTAEITW